MAPEVIRLSRPPAEAAQILDEGVDAGQELLARANEFELDTSGYHEWVRDLERWHALYRDAVQSCYVDEEPAAEFYSAATSGIWRRWGGQAEQETFAYRLEGIDAGINVLRSLKERLRFAQGPVLSHTPPTTTKPDPAKVFVVHGRNELARRAMFELLRSLKLEPLEWSELVVAAESLSPYIGQVLDEGFSRAQAVVVLLTPDDEARLRRALLADNDADHERELTPQARQNVLFEAGMAFGRFPERTVIVELGKIRPFSDVAGRHTVKTNERVEWRHDLAGRLSKAGCAVSTGGSDWLSAGDFEQALKSLERSGDADDEDASPRGPRPVQLEVQVVRRKSGVYDLLVRNVGEAPLQDVEVIVPDDAKWTMMIDELPEYPIARLDAGDAVPIYTIIAMGSRLTERVTLRARVGGEAVERTQVVALR